MPSCPYPPMSAKVSQRTSKLDGRNVGVDIFSYGIGLPFEGLRVPPRFQRLSGVHWHARVSDLIAQGRTCSAIRSQQVCFAAVHRSMRSVKFFGIEARIPQRCMQRWTLPHFVRWRCHGQET